MINNKNRSCANRNGLEDISHISEDILCLNNMQDYSTIFEAAMQAFSALAVIFIPIFKEE